MVVLILSLLKLSIFILRDGKSGKMNKTGVSFNFLSLDGTLLSVLEKTAKIGVDFS